MLKLLLFAFVVSHGIRAIRSAPADVDSGLSDSSLKNETVAGFCPCIVNGIALPPSSLSFGGGLPQTQNSQDIRNVIPPPTTPAFEWKCNLVAKKTIRSDYRCTPGIGYHKFHTRSKTWNDARKICIEEGAHLAIVNSVAEAEILTDLLLHSGPIKGAVHVNQAFVGIHDLYSEGEWVTIQGDSLAKTGYNAWTDRWGGQPDNGGGIQNCGTLIDDTKFDDVACSVTLPFYCEIPL